jgi:hypothetical protein
MLNFPKTPTATHQTALTLGGAGALTATYAGYKTAASVLSKTKSPVAAVAFATLTALAMNTTASAYTARHSCNDDTTPKEYLKTAAKHAGPDRAAQGLELSTKAINAFSAKINPPKE